MISLDSCVCVGAVIFVAGLALALTMAGHYGGCHGHYLIRKPHEKVLYPIGVFLFIVGAVIIISSVPLSIIMEPTGFVSQTDKEGARVYLAETTTAITVTRDDEICYINNGDQCCVPVERIETTRNKWWIFYKDYTSVSRYRKYYILPTTTVSYISA